jgi:hypothetical protein
MNNELRDGDAVVSQERGATQVRTALTGYLIAAAANLSFPLFLAPLSDRSNSIRAIIALAGILLAILTFAVGKDLRSRGLIFRCAGIVMLCGLALPSIRWGDLGPGTFGLLAAFAIPALAKLAVRAP